MKLLNENRLKNANDSKVVAENLRIYHMMLVSYGVALLQVIPGDVIKHVLTNHSFLWCKTLLAHFNVNVLVYSLLKFVYSTLGITGGSWRAQNDVKNVSDQSYCKFRTPTRL